MINYYYTNDLRFINTLTLKTKRWCSRKFELQV